ncbi:MAG: DUF1127 domain-containing protein [Neomegalonema sp.]|nr:DUF1127 domain-containing protein [Neomegalonema sp.]
MAVASTLNTNAARVGAAPKAKSGLFAGLSKRVDHWLEQYREKRALAEAAAELGAMSDRELYDLGLSRGQIHQAVQYGLPK